MGIKIKEQTIGADIEAIVYSLQAANKYKHFAFYLVLKLFLSTSTFMELSFIQYPIPFHPQRGYVLQEAQSYSKILFFSVLFIYLFFRAYFSPFFQQLSLPDGGRNCNTTHRFKFHLLLGQSYLSKYILTITFNLELIAAYINTSSQLFLFWSLLLEICIRVLLLDIFLLAKTIDFFH